MTTRRLPRLATRFEISNEFSSRAEAVRAARQFIWGDVTFAKREFVSARTHPDLYALDHRGLPTLAVTAQVNNDLVVIDFDHYGRQTDLVVLPRR